MIRNSLDANEVYVENFSSGNGDSLSNDSNPSTERALDGIIERDSVKEKPNDTCNTLDCRMASRVSNLINSSIDPCNNFYDFACGHSKERLFSIDLWQMSKELKMMITSRFPDESREMELVKKLYESCMNRTEIDAVGMKPFNEIVQRIGGWPIIEGARWNTTAYDWAESMRQMAYVGLVPKYLFSASVEPNFKNSSIRSLMVPNQHHFV